MNKYISAIVWCLIFFGSSAYASIEIVSLSSSGEQGNDGSGSGIISADGRYVAFQSGANNLVEADDNDFADTFVHDRQTGTTQIVNVSSDGVEANHYTQSLSMSDDGRYLAFTSSADNLVEGDTNGVDRVRLGRPEYGRDVFVHDRQTGITERVNLSSSGEQASNITSTGIEIVSSLSSSISADGRYVAFSSNASNLVQGDTNNHRDIFVHDRETGTTTRVNVSSSGEQGTSASPYISTTANSPSISANGRYVTFSSNEKNLVDVVANHARQQLYLHDRELETTEILSISPNGEPGYHENQWADSINPSISDDGRFVAFSSKAKNLVRGDTNTSEDIFVRDRVLGSTKRVSVSSTGEQATYDSVNSSPSVFPKISANGRFVIFSSLAKNFVPNDTNNSYDVFIHDLETSVTERLSVSSNNEQGNRASFGASISADSRYISIGSAATNLVDNDTNGNSDTFVLGNPLLGSDSSDVMVTKMINNAVRDLPARAAKLSTGTLYKQAYEVINNSPNRIYQVKVFENGNLACNFYALNANQTKQRCITFQTVLEGDQQAQVTVTAKASGSGNVLTSGTNAYYTGLSNVTGKLRVSHGINNSAGNLRNSDTENSAAYLNSSPATISFKVENIGEIELYQVKTYHDPVSPVNSAWAQQCVIGSMKPGQVRYCKRDIPVTETGLNQAMGRVQGRNAIRSATNVVNAANPTYFILQ